LIKKLLTSQRAFVMNRFLIKKFVIIEINEYNYVVADEDGQLRDIFLQFYDLSTLPRNGDYICLSEKYFDKKANEGYMEFRFGGLSEPYGRDVTNTNLAENEEVITIIQGDKKTYLKRFYG